MQKDVVPSQLAGKREKEMRHWDISYESQPGNVTKRVLRGKALNKKSKGPRGPGSGRVARIQEGQCISMAPPVAMVHSVFLPDGAQEGS